MQSSFSTCRNGKQNKTEYYVGKLGAEFHTFYSFCDAFIAPTSIREQKQINTLKTLYLALFTFIL